MMWTWKDALNNFFTEIGFPSYESIYALNNKYDVALYDVLLVESLGRYVFKTHENYDFVYFMTLGAGQVPDNYVMQFNIYKDNNTVTGFQEIVITPEIKARGMSRGEYRIYLNYQPIWFDKILLGTSASGLTLEQISKAIDGQYVIGRSVDAGLKFLAGAIALAFMGPIGWKGLFAVLSFGAGTFALGESVNESIEKEMTDIQAKEDTYKKAQENTPPPPPPDNKLLYAVLGIAGIFLMNN